MVSFDVYQNSYELASHLVKAMNYQGNLLEITGVPGVADAATATAAATAAIKGHSGLHIVGSYTGEWTASVAQQATSQWLASHPGVKVDGIIDEGAMGIAAETALQQAGRPLAKVSLQEGDCQELAFQKQHPSLVPYMTDQAPAPGSYAAMAWLCASWPASSRRWTRSCTRSPARPIDVQPVVQAQHDGEQRMLRLAEAGAPGHRELPRAVLHRRQHRGELPRALLISQPSGRRATPLAQNDKEKRDRH